MNKANQTTTDRHVEIARERFLRDLSAPLTREDLLTDLAQLAVLAEGDWTARDVAERRLLRYINDPEIAAAYYEVRRRCS